MLYSSRLVFSEDLMRFLFSLLLAKDHFFDPIHFCTCKTVTCGAFFVLFFFNINSPLPCTPLQKRPMPGWVVNINDILCTVLLSWFLLFYCSVLQSIFLKYYSHCTVK